MDIPETLRKRLREGKVIPFVGAGVSMSVVNRDTGERLFPSWSQLLLQAADRLEQEHMPAPAALVRAYMNMGRAQDYLPAAEEARKALGPVWFDFLKDHLDPPRRQVADESLRLASLVWELNSELVITTNYDKVLQWASPAKDDLQLWNIEATAEHAELVRNGVRSPTVWHLHGRIDDAARLILTPGGYALLYPGTPGVESRYRAALHTLRSLFASHTFLFVGFSMDDEQFSRQLQHIDAVFEGATGPHYVLVRKSERERVEALGRPVVVLPYEDFGQPLLDALSELVEAAREADAPPPPSHDGKPTATVPVGGGETAAPAPVFFVPFLPKGADVVGRETALQAVRRQLVEGRRTQIGQTAAFQGLGGLGKTQLAVEYAYRYREEYPGGVIWLTADQDIDAQLTELAPKAGWIAAESEHKYKLDVAMQRLRTHSGLLVFDNVESRDVIEPYLPARETGAHILLTSRTEQQDFVAVPLDVLDLDQSLELLTREAGHSPENKREQEAIREIAVRFGGLPLALELAGAFIRHRGVGWELYRDRLNRNPRKALTGRFLQSSTKHESDLYSTLQIDEEVFEEEPLLRDILDVLAWSGRAPMGISLLSAMLSLDDPTDLTDALGLGVALRLLQKTPGTDSYAIHRLVSEVWRDSHPINERRQWVEAGCSRLGDWFQARKENFFDLPNFEAEIDHLRAWQENAVITTPDDSVRLLWLQAYPHFHRGQYKESHRYVQEALVIFPDHENLETRELFANLLNDLGFTLNALGRHEEALEYCERALKARLDLFGEQHPDTAKSLGNVGVIYNRQGEYGKAMGYLKHALMVRLNLFGEWHPDTAISLCSLGSTYAGQGEYGKALEYYNRALAIYIDLFGERYPDTATVFNDIGVVLNSIREYNGAMDSIKHALAIYMDLFGEQHPFTATGLSNVGDSYSRLGDYGTALTYQERALGITRHLFGERSPRTVLALDKVGVALGNLGEHTKAVEYKRQAVAIGRDVMGDGHSRMVEVVLSLAMTLKHLGRSAEAFDLLHDLSSKLNKNNPMYTAVEQHLHALSRNAVRPGFRQPRTSKQGTNKKGKPKKKR